VVKALTIGAARELAWSCLHQVPGTRWQHVQTVGVVAAGLMPAIGERVAVAAWLHDVGYGAAQVDTGMHAVDGARYLRRLDADPAVVSLVAHHSGACFEAATRGMSAELAEFDPPDRAELDALTLVDFTTGPAGERVPASTRVDEILNRYEPAHPVHRSVSLARAELLAAVARAARRLGLPDEGFLPPS
jgi:hypothetical protein